MLDEVQKAALTKLGINLASMTRVVGRKIPGFVENPEMYWDGKFLVFINTDFLGIQKYLYALTTKQEGKLEFFFNNLAVYSRVHPMRFKKYEHTAFVPNR